MAVEKVEFLLVFRGEFRCKPLDVAQGAKIHRHKVHFGERSGGFDSLDHFLSGLCIATGENNLGSFEGEGFDRGDTCKKRFCSTVNQSINPSINPSTDQSINQSIDGTNHYEKACLIELAVLNLYFVRRQSHAIPMPELPPVMRIVFPSTFSSLMTSVAELLLLNLRFRLGAVDAAIWK